MALSAYIHIPFCSHKCDFCDFAAFAGVDHLEDEYTDVVCQEIRQRLSSAPKEQLELASIFFGGGTPGLVKPQTLNRVKQALVAFVPLASDAEVCLETTPHAISVEKAHQWLNDGINRLSIGIESLQDNELKSIGRDHTRAQALKGLSIACAAGFSNVSCDFMYALPTQTLASWQGTLSHFVQLTQDYPQIKHASAYGLHLAQNSPLYSRFPRESSSYPDDELFEQMYFMLVDTLEAAGFQQYEVSNFARPGYESVHNFAYWNNAQYYGFGVSAHRYLDGVRSSNWRSLKRYMKDCLGTETSETIDCSTRIRESIMLGLRTRAGVDLAAFQTEYGYSLIESLRRAVEKLESGGFVEICQGKLRITRKGVPVSNSIIAELI